MKPSLRRDLTLWLSGSILAVAVLAGALSFLAAYQDANEIQDDVLRQVAALAVHAPLPAMDVAPGHETPDGEEARIILAVPGKSRLFPRILPDGLHTITASNGETYRVLVRQGADGRRIAVAQPASFRAEIASDGAFRTIIPILVLIPVLTILMTILVRRLFAPVTHLAETVDSRDERDLRSLAPGPVPDEIRPFVQAIDRLLARIAASVESERRFVADAAHELRSPLTALSLQAERLEQTDLPDEARERLGVLRQGIARGIALVEQMLALARAQRSEPPPTAPVSVPAMFRRVLEDLLPLAEAKSIDLGIESADDIRIIASEIDLFTLIRNLADNAVRYTPPGGRIDLEAADTPDGVTLIIRDTGPGIPPDLREAVLAPFHRLPGSAGPGSGLGLSIVQVIVDRLDARIRLDYTDRAAETGLTVTVTLPAA